MRHKLGVEVILTVGILACGDSTEGSPTDAEQACRAHVMDLFDRASQCAEIDQSKLDEALAACANGGPMNDITVKWRPEFSAAFDACYIDLACEDLEDAGDLCFPVAVEAGVGDLLTTATIDACIVSSSSEGCAAVLAAGSETNTNVVARCFQRWSACADQLVNTEPYWTEDHCGTLIALKDVHRRAAEGCIDLPCAMVSACLVEAGAFNF